MSLENNRGECGNWGGGLCWTESKGKGKELLLLSFKYSLHYSQQALQSRAVLLIDYADPAQLTNTFKEWQAGLRLFLTYILAQKAEDCMAVTKWSLV